MSAIVFDIDDTLYSRQDLFIRAASEISGQDMRKVPSFVDTFYAISDLNTEQLEKGLISTIESNSWRFDRTFRELGIEVPPDAGNKTAIRYAALQSSIELTPGFENLLSRLRDSDIEMGILTAGASEHQWDKYDQLGMERFIPRSKVIVAGDVGCSKPDTKIFRITEQILCERQRENIYMVGDSYKHDITGAINAGWRSVWINRRGRELSANEIPPSYEVSSEEELIRLLIRLFLEGADISGCNN